MTNDLIRRVYEHKNDLTDGFTKKYGVHLLVYFEQYYDIVHAIQSEKRLKKWNRQWKIELIEKENPEWNDLYIQCDLISGFPIHFVLGNDGRMREK